MRRTQTWFLKNSTKEALAAFGFLAPNLTGFLVFTSLPVLASFALSFVRWDLFSSPQFTGLDNFIRLLQDPYFWKYCWNTIYLMGAIPLSMAGSLMLALAQNDKTIPSEEKNILLTDALTMSETLKGDHHPGLIPVILALARFHQEQGKTDLALPLFYRALKLVEDFFGPGHLGIAHIYVYLAEILSL